MTASIARNCDAPSQKAGAAPPPRVADRMAVRVRTCDTSPGAPVSDPAGFEIRPETRRVGDRRSAMPLKSGDGQKAHAVCKRRE